MRPENICLSDELFYFSESITNRKPIAKLVEIKSVAINKKKLILKKGRPEPVFGRSGLGFHKSNNMVENQRRWVNRQGSKMCNLNFS